MPDSKNPFIVSALKPSGRVKPLSEEKSELDTAYMDWVKSKKPEHLAKLMEHASPIIDKAITSYAPGSSPAVRSQAKILAKKAFESYSPMYGTKLQTHLLLQLQPLRREAGSYDTLHVPEGVRFDMKKLNDAHNTFVEQRGREPSDEELADFTGMSTKRIAHVRKHDLSVIGESSLSAHDDGDENAESMPAFKKSQSAWRDMVYMELNPVDKLMFDLKTGRNGRKVMSVSDIARKLKLTPGAVSQRLSKIDRRLAEGAEYESVLL